MEMKKNIQFCDHFAYLPWFDVLNVTLTDEKDRLLIPTVIVIYYFISLIVLAVTDRNRSTIPDHLHLKITDLIGSGQV